MRGSKKHLIGSVAYELHTFLLDAVQAHGTDILRAKIAVEAAGVLDDRRRDLVDLFQLNHSFARIPLIINFKALVLLLQGPIRLCAVLLIQMLYIATLTQQLILLLSLHATWPVKSRKRVELLSKKIIPEALAFDVSKIENTFSLAPFFCDS